MKREDLTPDQITFYRSAIFAFEVSVHVYKCLIQSNNLEFYGGTISAIQEQSYLHIQGVQLYLLKYSTLARETAKKMHNSTSEAKYVIY